MGTAPPYEGEGPFALWHFSEDPDLHHFEPHRAPSSALDDEFVWAIDTRHAPHYWFPRDCPRGCAWVTDHTTEEDRVRFLGHSKAVRLYVMETAWVPAMLDCRLFAYRMPEATFERLGTHGSGHWVSRQAVDAVERIEVGNLFARIAAAGIELRVTPDVWPFWHSVIYSTLDFSGTRLRNATNPEPPLPPRPWRWDGR